MNNSVLMPVKELNLRAGDMVRVKGAKDILSTLDPDGSLDKIPFMPEMLQFCGKEFRVGKRADKTCDTINKTGGRRLYNTVHLDNLRCDGKQHGSCDASCLLFWKEAWLEKLPTPKPDQPEDTGSLENKAEDEVLNNLIENTKFTDSKKEEDIRYKCQTTELFRFTEFLPWWDLRQYYRDWATGNVTFRNLIRVSIIALFRNIAHLGIGYRFILSLFDKVHNSLGTIPWPYKKGSCVKTPKETLDLVAGELVEIKSHDEILATLNKENRNRGLYFDAEAAIYCGKQFRVLKRVKQILDEESGKMLKLPNDCVILEDVVCKAEHSSSRLFCPRAIYPYWREIWLKRVDET